MNQKILIISILFSFIVIYSGTESGVDEKKVKGINVTAIASEGPFTNLEMNILDSFKSGFKSIGIYTNDSPLYEILLSFKELNDSETIISVTLLQPISEKIIALGKKNQIFYSEVNLKNKKSGKANKEIREYISEEYMKQFRIVLDSYIYILSNKKLKEEIKRIITNMMNNPILKKTCNE